MNFDLNKIIIALGNLPGIGKAKIRRIVNEMEIDQMEYDELIKLLKNKFTNLDLSNLKNYLTEAKKLIEKSLENSITIINYKDKQFPKSLNIIKNPPNLIFVRGSERILQDENKNIAVIGTRKPSDEGYQMAFDVAQHLTKKGFNIVSGLASGCDTQAHKGCLAKNGLTVAVMPCGLNKVYPKSNHKLAKDILEKGGALISEYLPDESTKPFKFVERDRLQSGLSKEVILIESDLDGGSMKTINFAKEQNKKIKIFFPSIFTNITLGNKKLINEKNLNFKKVDEINL